MKETRFIGVISGKGGVGKTTVVANIGAALSKEFKKDVVIVDCNLTTSHLSLSLGMYYCPLTINDVLRGDKHILEAMYDHPSGMKIVPASVQLTDLALLDVARLENIVKNLEGKVDVVILDAPPGLGREAYATIRASDEIIFVTNPNMPAAADIIKCKEIVESIKKKPIGVVLNMFNSRTYELSRKEVEVLTELPVIATVPTDKNVAKSLAKRAPVVMHKPRASSSKELVKLAGRLIGEEREGFFSRFLRKFKKQ